MRSAAVLVVVAMALPPAVGQDARWERLHEERVWVRASFGSNLETKAEVEAADFGFPAGLEMSWGLRVVNDRSDTIRNVTLTLHHQGAAMNLTLGETYAGNEPKVVYAHWPSVEPGNAKLALLWMEILPHSSGWFRITALVTFEDERGAEWAGTTVFKGDVESPDGVVVRLGSGAIWALGAAALAVVAGVLWALLRTVPRKPAESPAFSRPRP